MKTNAIIRIVLFSIALLVLLGIFSAVILYDTYLYRNDSHNLPVASDGTVNQGIVSSEIKNIEIEWAAGNITIEPSEDAKDITISEYCQLNSKYTMVYRQSGRTLKIQFCEESIEFPSFGINVDVSKDLVVTVPAAWIGESIEIDAASAVVEMSGLTVREFDFDGASGNCSITDCDITDMDIDTASGNVSFSGTLEKLDCDVASANCTIEVFNIPRSIELDGMSGDLELILPPDAGFICKLDTLSGSFHSDFAFSTHSDTYVSGDGECKINASAMSGDVRILKGIE